MQRKDKNMISRYDPRVAQIGHPAPPWMVNYADLMTELVCFFVILYALSAALSKDIKNAKEQLEEMMKNENVKAQVEVTKDGLYLTLEEQEDKMSFNSGSAELTDGSKGVLDKVVPVLAGIPNEVVVEGHTDDTPMHSAVFDSNWELSTARATNVVKYFVQQKGLSPKKLSAVGYGENKPLGPNDSPENRSKNRRVVIFIKK